MKLSTWAKSVGVSYQTAWNMFKAGNLPGAYQLPTGTIVIKPESTEDRPEHTIVLACHRLRTGTISTPKPLDWRISVWLMDGWFIRRLRRSGLG